MSHSCLISSNLNFMFHWRFCVCMISIQLIAWSESLIIDLYCNVYYSLPLSSPCAHTGLVDSEFCFQHRSCTLIFSCASFSFHYNSHMPVFSYFQWFLWFYQHKILCPLMSFERNFSGADYRFVCHCTAKVKPDWLDILSLRTIRTILGNCQFSHDISLAFKFCNFIVWSP